MDNVDNVDWTKFLERKRISKSDAARLLGAAPAMVTEWIKGKNNPTHKYLKRLCMAGMTAQEMFGEDSRATISDADCEKIAEFVYSRRDVKESP